MSQAGSFGKPEYRQKSAQEKFRIAIIYQVASFWPSIESLYQACLADSDVEIQIFHIREFSVERAQTEGADVFLQKNGIRYITYSEEKLLAFGPHAAIYQTPYDVSFRNPSALSLHLRNMGIRVIYIPYGIEIADTEDARCNHFFSFVVLNSWRLYTFSQVMKADYDRYCPNRHAVRALGVPKFDSLFQKGIQADAKIQQQAAGRQVVLWKLHFPKLIHDGQVRRQVTPYLSEYLKFAQTIAQYSDLFFVVMPHPMFTSHTIDRNLSEEAWKLFDLLKTKENVAFDWGMDYRKTLYHADAIIVDRSALMVEAGFCGVPVLYMSNSEYEEPLTEAVRPLAASYAQGTHAEDMHRFLESFRKNELQALSKKIQAVGKMYIPFVDGKCGERILADIKHGILEEEDQTLRLIFFGASFICEHYIQELRLLDNPAVHIVCLSDNDEKKWGTALAGIQILPPNELQRMEFDLLVITSENYYVPIKQQLVYRLFLEERKVLPLDEFAEQYRKGLL